ncbi:DUF4279 domain-containing protein [Leptospira wolffii]|uniref:DUF4279 domain-containing protein n=1 Tax=Leptospira wolffii TaxID=409998 RepID=UPI0010823D39|nr:DUF4279 domain-containing protein [Leptospira wolffii]TGL47450.1 DUF4279 domain-containing protein [Leptospira wolffii]
MKTSQSPYPKCWALISISHPNLDTQTLTRELGIRPDLSVGKGVPSISGSSISAPVWQIYSKKEANAPLEDHIWELLERISPRRKEFQTICEKYSVVLYCSVEYNNDGLEETSLSPRTLLLIGNLGLTLSFHAWRIPEKGRRLEDKD